MLKEITYSKIKKIDVGLTSLNKALFMARLNQTVTTPYKEATLSSNQRAFEYEWAKEIDVKLSSSSITKGAGEMTRISNSGISLKHTFISGLIIPHVFEEGQRAQTVATIYREIDGSRITSMDKFPGNFEAKLNVQGVSGDIHLSVTEPQNHDEYDEVRGQNILSKWRPVKDIRILDSTYYDYEKHKTVIGIGRDSEIGLQIPYNYKGIYRMSMKMKLNDFLDNIKLDYFYDIKNKLLDEFDGDIVLNIENNFKTNITANHIIGKEKIQEVKDSSVLFSIKALKRMSIDKT